MLKPSQRLVAYAILHETYSSQPSSLNPFISLLVNVSMAISFWCISSKCLTFRITRIGCILTFPECTSLLFSCDYVNWCRQLNGLKIIWNNEEVDWRNKQSCTLSPNSHKLIWNQKVKLDIFFFSVSMYIIHNLINNRYWDNWNLLVKQ